MKNYSCTEDRFLKDVEQHIMTVLRDDGVHRHIRFKGPQCSAYWFDLITWPGTLCIDGDCGTYVFRRMEDMFEFFRIDRDWLRDGATLSINPGYWGEKLQATANGGFKEFSEDSFRENVKRFFDDWVESNQPDDDCDADILKEFNLQKHHLWEEIDDEVLSYIEDGAHACYQRVYDFTSETVPGFAFNDFWEVSSDEYTFHFIWCCYAITWGVNAYDDAMLKARNQ